MPIEEDFVMTKSTLVNGLIVLFLAGCSGTTTVLMPDESGKVGKVDIQNQAGRQTLSQAHESTSTSKHNEQPGKSQILSKEDIRENFSDVLAVQPDAPLHNNLQGFVSGSADIGSYDKEIDGIIDTVKSRKSCDIVVIGHCDSVGSNADNEAISKARAANVKQALIDKGIPEKCIGEIRFYGESDLFIQTGDNVDEPLNRRVEVEIR